MFYTCFHVVSGEPCPSPCMFYTCFHVSVENLVQVPVCSTLVSIFQWRTLSKSLYVLHLFPCYSGEPCPSPCMFHLFPCYSGEPCPSPCMFYTCFHLSVENLVQVPVCSTHVVVVSVCLHLFPVVENLIQVPVCSTRVSIFQWRTLSKSLYVLHLFPSFSGEPCPSPCMFYTCCSVSIFQWRTLSKSLYVLHKSLFPCLQWRTLFPSPSPVCSTLVSML